MRILRNKQRWCLLKRRVKTEETFRVKHEDTETQTKMMFIKEESEDMKIEETFRVKHEDIETQRRLR